MKMDKLTVFFISSLVFLVITSALYLSTYLRSDTDNFRLRQLESDLKTITTPITDSAAPTSSVYSTASTPVTTKMYDNHDDIGNPHPSAYHNQNNQPSSQLTEDDIKLMIAALETKRAELLHAYEEKIRLRNLVSDEAFAHDAAFEVEFQADLARYSAIEKKFEHEVLGGRTVDEVVRMATPKELEELENRPESRVLTEATLQRQKLYADFNAEQKTLADKANVLMNEAAKFYDESVEINNAIADLRTMLE